MTEDIFKIVRLFENASLEGQKITYSTLKAIESTIKESGKPLVPAAYFANILVLLQKQLEGSRKSQPEISSTMQLFALLMPSLSVNILRTHFVAISNTLVEVVGCDMQETSALDRYLVTSLACLINAQEASQWSSSTLNQLFHIVIAKTEDSRPKVRKCAIAAVQNVLSHPPPPMVNHPGSSLFVRHVQQKLQEGSSSGSEGEQNNDLHLVLMLQDCWKYLKPSQSVQLAKHLIKSVLKRGQVHGQNSAKTLTCLSCFVSTLAGDIAEWNGLEFLSPLLNAKPVVNDVEALTEWSQFIVHTLEDASTKGKLLDGKDLSQSFLVIFTYLKNTPASKETKIEAHKVIVSRLLALTQLLTDDMINSSLDSSNADAAPFTKILVEVKKGLTLSYQSGWAPVLDTISVLVLKCKPLGREKCEQLFLSILQILGKDQVFAQNPHFDHMNEFQGAIATLVSALGVEKFLVHCPLNLESGEQPNRSWLLPILKEQISSSPIATFMDTFEPMTVRMAVKGGEMMQSGQLVESKTCAVIWRQLWDLLPSFCLFATDVQESFKRLFDMLSPIVKSEDDDRCVPAVEALKNLAVVKVSSKKEIIYDVQMVEQNAKYLATMSHIVFPLLFDKYISVCGGVAAASTTAEKKDKNDLLSVIMEAIKVWTGLAPVPVVNKFFETAIKAFLQMTSGKNQDGMEDSAGPEYLARKHAIFDLAIVLIPSGKLMSEAVQVFMRITFIGMTSSDDGIIQKKSYKALDRVYKVSLADQENDENSATASIIEKLKANLWQNPEFIDNLCSKIVNSLLVTDASAKKDRLACIGHVLPLISWERPLQLNMLPAILTEVILGTKESNEKSRTLAYETLILLAQKFEEIERESGGKAVIIVSEENEEGDDGEPITVPVHLDEFFKMVVAGLAGKTPHMISATIFSLSRLLHEYPESSSQHHLSPEVSEAVIDTVLTYALESKNREIINAAIGFVKVIMSSYPSKLYKQQPQHQKMMEEDAAMGGDGPKDYLETVVKCLVEWISQHKSHFRVTCRHILERILRKVDFSLVESYFPEEHLKLLKNLRKRRERALKKTVSRKSLGAGGDEKQRKSFDQIMNEDQVDDEDAADGGDDGSEMDDDDIPEVIRELVALRTLSSNKSSKSSRKNPLLTGGDEDEPVDFLDSRFPTAKSSFGKSEGKGKRKRQFEEREGKLVIEVAEGGAKKAEQFEAAEEGAGGDDYLESLKSKDAFTRTHNGKRVKFANKSTAAAAGGKKTNFKVKHHHHHHKK